MKLEPTVQAGGPEGRRREKPEGRTAAAPAFRARQELVLAAVGILVAITVVAAWRLSPARVRTSFPRQASEFLPPAELDRRLARAEDRLKAVPDDIEALSEAGVLYFQKGPDQYPDAINELEEARKLGALDPRIFYYLGVMYQEEGLYPFAAEAYQRFLRNNAGDIEVSLLLAKLHFQQNQFEEAAEQYRRILQIHPKDPLISENLAVSLWKGDKRDEAAAVFSGLSVRKDMVGRRARFYLGQMAFEDKEYTQALRYYLAVLPAEGEPDLGLPPDRVHAAFAADFEKVKLYRDAKTHWEKVLQTASGNSDLTSQAKKSLKTVNAALDKADRAAKAAARQRKKKKK